MKWPIYSLLSVAICFSCAKNDTDTTGLAARVGTKKLTVEEVANNIPTGILPADSAKFANDFINNWLEEQASTMMAERMIPDTETIDKMVEDYRRQLLMWEYRRAMTQQNGFADPDEKSVNDYYESHKHLLKLSRPVIKGVYIKIPDNAKEIKEIRKLYRSEKFDDIDKLEKLIGNAVNYEYFRDSWTDWGLIESRIPAPVLDNNPDSFPLSNDHLEISNDGFVYFLAISDVIPAGAQMPLDVARTHIIEALKRENSVAYDKTLRKQLLDQAIADGTAEVFVNID